MTAVATNGTRDSTALVVQSRGHRSLIAYTRTSKTGDGSDSLDAQAEACESWAQKYGHAVVSVERDEALSGGLSVEQRPGLLAALLALEDGRADGIVVHRLDRLARELHVQEAALAQAWSVGDHIEVFEATEGLIKRDDPADPHRRFLRQVLGAAAELERGLIRARLQGGRRRKAARGGWVGGHRLHPRFGYRVEDGEYVPLPEQQQVIDHMAALRARDGGRTYREVAAALNAAGVAAPAGAQWYAGTVRKVLIREERVAIP